MIYPSLTKLRTFAAVAEYSSFRKASAQLHLSQPALSAHIRDLEDATGVSLFDRTTRTVRLTQAGERFLDHVRRALAEIESGLIEIRDEVELRRGQVVVACVPMVAFHVLPHVLADFSERHPRVKVRIYDVPAEAMRRRVLDRVADIGIGPCVQVDDDLEFHTLVHDPFVAVVPAGHELAGASAVRLMDLVGYPLLTLAAGTTVRDTLDRAFAQQGVVLRPAYEVSQQYSLGGLVEAGLGIALVPAMSSSMLKTPRLCTVKVTEPEIVREVGFIQRRGQTPSPSVSAFLITLSDRLSQPARAG